jgi:Bacterial Ig domain/Cadherin-like domain/Haemolysin-type calcium binding protein related domain/RTX calcium-binding nonapeptide repeat (4 copies)
VSGYGLADVARFWRSPPSGNDLIVDFADGGRIILSDALATDNIGVDSIEFDDAIIVTTDSLRAQILLALNNDADGSIWGFASNDTLAGGKGTDTLSGGLGDDVYRYAKGDGFDAIEDNGAGFDRIIIEGYASSEVMASALYRDDDGIVLRFAGSHGDELIINNLLGSDAADQIEEIEFADGVIWTRQSIVDLLGNSAPATQSDGFESVVQGRQIRIDPARILANDFDADNDPLSIISVTATIGGTVEIAPDGKILFTAAADFTGLTSFSYTVSDGRNGFATDIVRVRVRPVASASDDSGFVLDEDGTFILRQSVLLANDADGDQLRISQALGAQNGIVSLASNGDITFTPVANYNGTASFRYIANTPEGAVTEAKATLTVRPVNDGPTARNDELNLVTNENQSFTFDPVRSLYLR